ncbi:xylitol oxidase [Silvibacterium bohemicum]|uniref:Xylitol oxidase n=1 Tax=Silvibacterium bohemicum TaxID=1577686 RepID=A0A841K6Y8_9BACT|nr:D-arabinono-1,4-lactone oxidase [Silvibacterium bohemicum]MBB6146034.1 xylitol oxidase [Silvibacterium bohemicum]
MDKREFIKTSAVVAAGSMFSRILNAELTLAAHRTNWAGNLEYSTDHLYLPATVEETQANVKACAKIKALGARHSFNRIADSKAAQISPVHLDSMEIDQAARTVTVGAGVKYGQLAPYLDSHGFALHNLASLPHVSVAGACATATHGSGSRNGNLSTAVAGMELVRADGSLVSLSRKKDGAKFDGMVVGLGALGVQTKVTLDLLPTFQAAQVVYQDLSFDRLETHLEEIFAAGYSVSLFTDWQDHRATQVWIKRKVEGGAAGGCPGEFFGAKRATEKLHPITGHDATPCTEQMGIPGPWYERLPHFKMAFTPSSGNEIQTEYFVPRDKGYEAILAVEQLKDRITPHLFVTELRTIAADDLWMSMAYQRPSMAIHFTWKPEAEAVHAVLPLIEKQLAPFGARPHWAKVFTMDPARIQGLYPEMAEFQALMKEYDPAGKFRNEFLDLNLFGA